MSDDDFFDSVFESPDDDPLLGDEPDSTDPPPSSPDERNKAPSWMNDDDPAPSEEPEQKTVVVAQHADHRRELADLNQAIRQGWEIVQLSLQNSEQGPRQFVATLEQQTPSSLFDL